MPSLLESKIDDVMKEVQKNSSRVDGIEKTVVRLSKSGRNGAKGNGDNVGSP